MINPKFWCTCVMLAILTMSNLAMAEQSLNTDTQTNYNDLKRVFTSMINDGQIQLGIKSHVKSFNIFDSCSDKGLKSGRDYVGGSSENDETSTLADLALEVVRLHITLSKLGYPETVWKSTLSQFEEALLPLYMGQIGKPYSDNEETKRIDRTTSKFQNRFIKELARYRQQKAPRLPIVYYKQGDCGAGEMSIYVQTEPSNGRVFFIPVFFHYLCKVQRMNPDDMTSCDRWREPANGQLFEVAGDYFYIAVWPDGMQQRGRLSFTKVSDGQTVTFSKKE